MPADRAAKEAVPIIRAVSVEIPEDGLTRSERRARGYPKLDGRRVLTRFAGVLARVPRYLRLGWVLFRDPAVPARGKVALGSALGYAVSPIDPVPGIIPVIGQLDDLFILLLGIQTALRAAPPDVAEQHLKTSGLTWEALDRDFLTLRATTIWIIGKAGNTAVRLFRWVRSRSPKPRWPAFRNSRDLSPPA